MINIQNIDDNECFRWCLFRYLHLADHNPRRITKAADKDFGEELNFKDVHFVVKIIDIHKIEKKNFIAIGVFGYENKVKNKYMYQKNIVKKNMLIYFW